MTKTLYVSDLDGTLLRHDETLSRYTVDTINALVAKGMIFSYATARSQITASKVTAGLSTQIPVIIYNGSFIKENGTGKTLLSNAFSQEESNEILDYLLQREVFPIVYAMIDGVEKFSYCADRESRGTKIFNDTRRGDVRDNPIAASADLYRGEIFHVTCIDEEEILRPIYEHFKDAYPCVFHRDIYSGEQWLEIQPTGATKAQAILAFKQHLGCDRVVCFGDGKNDVTMFEIADEGYAVENADPSLKAIATAIIGSNEQDGVARWLAENVDIQ
ncbi:MAG: HAD family hydrolase [Clostridia bacterium]|nr:HAD family hydrolase [Clostridia bacterium]